jgi:hypothetical protein
VAASGLGIWGASREIDKPWQGTLGKGLERLSQPVGKLVGTSYGQADAKAAEGAQAAAKWQLDDARDAIRRTPTRAQDQAVDWLRSLVDRDAATVAAILAKQV